MVSPIGSAANPFFYSAQLSAVTSGASASLNGINPALGLSADELQKEADALHGGHGRRGREGLPPAAHGWEKPQVQKALVKLGGAPAEAAPEPVQDEPEPAPGGMTLKEQAAALAEEGLQPAALPPAEITPASAASPEASYYEKRIYEMAKALTALASLPWPQNSVALILITGLPGGAAEAEPQAAPAPDLSGDDTIEQRADVIRGIATGDGADAVALEGRIVRGIHTDLDTGRPAGRDRAEGGWRQGQEPYANADSLSIRARHARNISTGGGDDAIAIQAGSLSGLRAGNGDDSIAVAATLVSRIKSGAGDDRISVAAQRALRGQHEGPAAPYDPDASAAQKMRQALSGYAQVDGGSGNDLIELQVGETLAARGGTGDDRFTLRGGTVALQYSDGDGNDTVELSGGANAMVQLKDMGATAYSMTRDGDTLTLAFDTGGSITFTNVSQGGAIGVATDVDAPIALLHQPPAVNATA
ncbi:hypothetical protein RA19_22045 [Leisingera sp. ANG-M1]|uniref:hypothetical protein n=1 Tax=Leisingera sp. ANG-M1 TaxID=1577895 RepID=UPI00057ECB98|nr:hypothetical protein [Leisingera sp. ANG-M1]KIC07810.1 hypothetical protein RA19_22045 [Leisingera sp. ANG-M1]